MDQRHVAAPGVDEALQVGVGLVPAAAFCIGRAA